MSRLHKPKAGFWIRLCVTLLYPLDGLLFRIRWRHLDRVTPPGNGVPPSKAGAGEGVIIALNHVSHIDTVLTARLVWQSGRVPRFMIKAGVFSKPIVGSIMRGAKQIPVYRGGDNAAKSLRDAVTALADGEAIVIYPEGTITRDPAQWPMQGKTGIARLALLSPDTPIIPIGQWGAQQLKGRGKWRALTRRTTYASVGQPLDLSRFRGAEPTADTLREITDVVMVAIRDEMAQFRSEPAPTEFFVPPRKYVDKS